MGQYTNETFEALKTFMIENYGAKIASGGKEIVKRCHICGDSRDKSSRHMYIGMKDGLIVYNCFKCQAKGIVDGKFFRDLNCYDIDMITLCNRNNKSNSSYTDMQRKTQFIRNARPILTYRNASETEKKLEYLRNRLGYNFTINDLSRFKIILNLYDYLNANNVSNLTRYKDICDQLDMFFLGFLSKDNSFITMRRLVPENKVHPNINMRYVNYNIYGLQDNSSRYYIIPGEIDPARKLKIHIAEGPFDILGVYLNTHSDKQNSIFAAIGGKSYLGIVQYFIRNFGFIDFDLHVYADNDVDDYSIINIKNMLSIFNIDIYLHRNVFPGEKDFGVKKENIDERILRL